MNGVAKIVHDDGIHSDGKGGYTQRRILSLTPSSDDLTHIILLCKVNNGRSSMVAYPCSGDGTQLSDRYIKVLKRVGLDTFLNHIGYRYVPEHRNQTRTAVKIRGSKLSSTMETATYKVEPPLTGEQGSIDTIRLTFEKKPQCASVTHVYDANLSPSKAVPLPYVSAIGWSNPSQALASIGIVEQDSADIDEDIQYDFPSEGTGGTARDENTEPADTASDAAAVEELAEDDAPDRRYVPCIDDDYETIPIGALVQELNRQGERIKDIESLSGADTEWTTPMDPSSDMLELTAWTHNRVYFTIFDDSELQFDSVSRNPTATN